MTTTEETIKKQEKKRPKTFILDPCCGGRMMWNNKQHPNVLYCDIREAPPGHIDIELNHSVMPDMIIDFRDMPFENKSFKLVVFDPPQLLLRKTKSHSMIAKKYGCLKPETWQGNLRKGFSECWRVLEDYGVLIFKWSDVSIPYKKVLEVFGKEPLFQNIIRKNSGSSTYWACFMKIPKEGD